MLRPRLARLPIVAILLFTLPAHAAESPPAAERIDRALASAAHCLIDAQSPDGAWRSHHYGLLKDGPSLTPHVALAVNHLTAYDQRAADAARHAEAYLNSLLDAGGQIKRDVDLVYPVYTVAEACRLGDLFGDHHSAAAWLANLRRQQLTESLEWRRDDIEFGGWSYALSPPHRPPAGRQRGAWDWSNLSATVDALETLHALDVPTDDPAFPAAAVFVRRCQNLAVDGSVADAKFDDGGFFFSPAEALRNKAGDAGVDAAGRNRFRSYGSATVDGIRALILCGAASDDPRVIAARRWLDKRFTADHNPGDFVAANEDIREATYFYYCRGVSRLLTSSTQARAIADALLRTQRDDGSWANRFTDGREDDALVATPLAVEALLNCREILRSSAATRSTSGSSADPLK
jgi:hypothetical protein